VAFFALGTGCGGTYSRDPLDYLPADTAAAVRIDVARFRGSPLDRRLRDLLAGSDFVRWKLDDFGRRLGVEPLRDLDTALMAAGPSQGQEPERAGFVLTGRIDRAKAIQGFRERAAAFGASVREERIGQGAVYFVGEDPWGLAVPRQGVALYATKSWLGAMLQAGHAKGPRPAQRKYAAEVAALLHEPQPRILRFVQVTARAGGPAGSAASSHGGEGDVPIDKVLVWVDSQAGLEFNVRLEARTEEDALALAARFKENITKGIASLPPEYEHLGSVARKLHASTQGGVVEVQASLGEAELATLVGAGYGLSAQWLRQAAGRQSSTAGGGEPLKHLWGKGARTRPPDARPRPAGTPR